MKEKNWLGTVLAFASECRVKMIFSVICAIISGAGGIVPYVGVYQIIVSFFDGSQTIKSILFWSGICLAGYVVKLSFYAISTMLAHFSAY
ncbi:MAG TPA: multidrug ABC transporter permease, partial [Clostridium sp.]|nr:multidrug ABC transporter permease [Clostridium sp.]